MTFKQIICPISRNTVNGQVVRLTGFMVALLVGLYAFTGSVYFIIFLFADFIIRGFTQLKVSPLAWIANKISMALALQFKPIDKAPKVFAARVGFVFTSLSLVLFYVNPLASIVIALILMTFALMESVFNFCVGCVVYTYLVLPFYKETN